MIEGEDDFNAYSHFVIRNIENKQAEISEKLYIFKRAGMSYQ